MNDRNELISEPKRRGRPPRDKERENREALAVVERWLADARRIDQAHATIQDLMGRSGSVVRPHP
jgi:hypothetical protein